MKVCPGTIAETEIDPARPKRGSVVDAEIELHLARKRQPTVGLSSCGPWSDAGSSASQAPAGRECGAKAGSEPAAGVRPIALVQLPLTENGPTKAAA